MITNPRDTGRASWFRKLVKQLGEPGKLLDFGCGLGELLVEASKLGWEGFGVEQIGAARETCQSRLGIDKIAGSLEEFGFPHSIFRAITATDVIEHLRQPDQEVARWRKLLEPGGILLITTIDAGSWSARIAGRSWVHWHRDHLWYFDKPALRAMIERLGFQILVHKTPSRNYSLGYFTGVLARYHGLGFVRRIMSAIHRLVPHWLPLPPIPEGQLLIARKIGEER